jgi:hypothetical protein
MKYAWSDITTWCRVLMTESRPHQHCSVLSPSSTSIAHSVCMERPSAQNAGVFASLFSREAVELVDQYGETGDLPLSVDDQLFNITVSTITRQLSAGRLGSGLRENEWPELRESATLFTDGKSALQIMSRSEPRTTLKTCWILLIGL